MIYQEGHNGGGIALYSGSNATVRNCLISENTTAVGSGAGIWIYNFSRPKILYNLIFENHTGLTERTASGAGGHAGSRSSSGGGISVSHDGYPEIVGNIIAMNRAGGHSDGGGVYVEHTSHPEVRANWIIGNEAEDDGGGIYTMKNAHPTVEDNLIAGNRNLGGWPGGGVRVSKEGRMTARHNYIVANSSGVSCYVSWMLLEKNIIADNSGPAVDYYQSFPHLMPSRIQANVIYGNGKNQIELGEMETGPPQVSNNVIEGGYPGEGNVNKNPMFVNDAFQTAILRRSHDLSEFTTRFSIGAATLPAKNLTGRVVQVGRQWSVIRVLDHDELTVWGLIKDDAESLVIISSYEPKDDLAVKRISEE